MNKNDTNFSEHTPIGAVSPDRYGCGRKVTYIVADREGQKPKKRLGIFMGFFQSYEVKVYDGIVSYVPIVVAIVEDYLDGSVKEIFTEALRFKRK